MKSVISAFKSRKGQISLMVMAAGIIVAAGGGYLLQNNNTLCDIVCIAGAVFSMIGAEQFCRLIIKYREETGED